MSSFPQPWHSTTSHWHATNRAAHSLWNANRETPLPAEAGIVIVGGGMMGAALAYFLTRAGGAGDEGHVVCLEAKDCGSGATGRNGGHVGPKTSTAWAELMRPPPLGLGCTAEEAVRIMQSERDNLDLVEEIVEQEQLDVDFWRGELYETHHSQKQSEWSKETYAAWLAARAELGMDAGDTSFVDDAAEAERLSRIKGTTSLHRRPGGSVHSHKLCTALMNAAARTGNLHFFSWTPVCGFPSRAQDGRWIVKTPRGNVAAGKVVLCTNAHTPHFFDKADPVHAHITPIRGQCATITPPPSYAAAGRLSATYNTLEGHYLVTTAGGQMVLGGGVAKYIADGRVPLEWYTGAVDDSEAGIHPVLTKDLAEFMPANFHNWGAEGYGEGLTRTWVGIMGDSADELPLVGGVPDKEGVYIAAGFSGHGMSRIFVTARGLADTIRTGTWDAALLPPEFEITPQRLQRAQEAIRAFRKGNAHAAVVDGEIMDTRKMRVKSGALWRLLGY